MVQLSKRMQAVADFVTPGCTVCDVGCDHAYLPIYLVQTKKARRAIAMDIGEGPLAIAQKNIHANGLDAVITTRRSDGLERLSYLEANCLIIAGMGGALIQRILSDHIDVAKMIPEIILQPQSEISDVRSFLCEHGFEIFHEDFLKEDGHFYVVLRTSFVGSIAQPYSEEELRYGRCLIQEAHPLLPEYLQRQLHTCEEILSHLDEELSMQTDEGKRESLLARKEQVQREAAVAGGVLERLCE